MRRIYCFLLLFILASLGACSVPVLPRYQPFPEGSASAPLQGYSDIQLGGDTYLILYRNHLSDYAVDPLDDKWLYGAQKYVLYRAAELAKSKGASYFVVLHKDDWNLISGLRGTNWTARSYVEPGAGIVMKVLYEYPSSVQSNDDRVKEVDILLKKLPEQYPGLADYVKIQSQDALVLNGVNEFRRWRLSVSGYHSVPVPGTKHKTLFGAEDTKFEPGSTVISQNPSGQFELAIWDDRLITPLRLLTECVKLAEQERYEVFKLEDWIVEEHRTSGGLGGSSVWFRTKVTIILQHQKDAESLDPIFVVDEIRKNVEIGRVWP